MEVRPEHDIVPRLEEGLFRNLSLSSVSGVPLSVELNFPGRKKYILKIELSFLKKLPPCTDWFIMLSR